MRWSLGRGTEANVPRVRRATALVAALALLAAACADEEREPRRSRPRAVTLALDFTPNAAHAGIYAAMLDGADRRHGVALRVREPSSGPDGLKLLAGGRADFGLLDIHDLGLARERGLDVVGVGGLVQRPLAAVIAAGAVRRPRDLEGRRVGVTGLPSDDAVLRAVVEHDGGRFDRVRRVTIGFTAVPSLAAGTVDAVTAFWNVEGVALRERGVRTREFRVEEFGAPVYPEAVLVTMRGTLEDRPELVAAVRAALTAGTESALRRPHAALAKIAAASSADPVVVRAQFEAVGPALRPPLALDRAALERWAAWDERLAILRERPDVGRAFAAPRD